MGNVKSLRGRGAQSNVAHRFANRHVVKELNEGLQSDGSNTDVHLEHAKSVITRNSSPDIPFNQSINPYRGCEHGCSYCYARATHAYLELSPGLDFERILFAKINASECLSAELSSKSYDCETIALGNNTDAYQPIERKLKITRSIVDIFERTRHPVSIVTKSALITRDMDLLSSLANDQLIHVAVSITTLDHSLAAKMEPRAASPSRRLNTIEKLSHAGVPVSVLLAPLIPAINDHEIEKILKEAKQHGVRSANYVLLRLPHEVKDVFADWLKVNFPLRHNKVLNYLASMFGGHVYRSDYGLRMRGKGEYASLIQSRFKLACKKVGLSNQFYELRNDLFRPDLLQREQMNLF